MRILFFLKISMMILGLAGIIYAMQYLKSKDFAEKSQSPDSALSVLLGSNMKPSNWCPENVSKLELVPVPGGAEAASRDVSTPQDQAMICEVFMEPVATADMEENFQVIIRASDKSGTESVLERNLKGVFRISGVPFRSSSLEKTLKRYNFY